MTARIGQDQPVFSQKLLPPGMLPILMAPRHAVQKQKRFDIAYCLVIKLNAVYPENAHCPPLFQRY